jgi:hypothetical protein
MPPAGDIDEIKIATKSVAARCQCEINQLGDIAAGNAVTIRRRDVEDPSFAVTREPSERDRCLLPSGRKSYVVQYRAGRRSRRISLGPSTVLTCEQARNRAITIIAAARNGEDPAAERDAGRKAITVKELAERFDKEHISIRVKASTAKEYPRNLERFILPALGRLSIMEIRAYQ